MSGVGGRKKYMEDTVFLEWAFSPEDYFEDEISIKSDSYRIEIKQGNVVATMSPEYYYGCEDTRDQLHKSLESRFLGGQLLTHRRYELSNASMHRVRPNGQRDVTIFPESCVSICSVGTVDLVVTDKDGNVISDSKAERKKKKRSFSELAEKYSLTPFVRSLLDSYKSAVYDPDNELVHLYEVREAISFGLGGEAKTRELLNISKDDWSTFGRLSNIEPLRQGRHRGKNYEKLRDATQAELEKCRTFSRKLIESYFDYLEEQIANK